MTISSFNKMNISRVIKLINECNQFNLTTKRYTINDIEEITNSSNYVTLYCNTEDNCERFGTESVVIGHKRGKILDIDLLLITCAGVRDTIENETLNSLSQIAKKDDLTQIRGYYYPTDKNSQMKDFYAQHKFIKISETSECDTVWTKQVK